MPPDTETPTPFFYNKIGLKYTTKKQLLKDYHEILKAKKDKLICVSYYENEILIIDQLTQYKHEDFKKIVFKLLEDAGVTVSFWLFFK